MFLKGLCEKCYYADRYVRKRVAVRRSWLRRYSIHRALIDEAKSGGCVDCGERDIRCLDFDHVRGEKVMAVGSMIYHSIERLRAEIAKCEVRCSNCHRKRTAERKAVA